MTTDIRASDLIPRWRVQEQHTALVAALRKLTDERDGYTEQDMRDARAALARVEGQ